MDQKFSKLRFKEFALAAAVGGALALQPGAVTATAVPVGSGTGVLTVNAGNAVWHLNNNISFATTSSNWAFSEASLHTASGTRGDAFDGALSWLVNGPAPTGGYVSPSGTIDITPFPINSTVGTTVTGAPQTIAGLTVTGQIYFSPVKAVARSMLIMHNPTGAPITVTVENASNLGSDNNTFYQATSSGNAAYDPTDNWDVTSQHAIPTIADDPIVTLAFSQTGAAVRSTPNPAPVNGSDKFFDFFTVTIPAGQTRRLMMFAQLSDTVAHAVTDAALFNTNASLQGTDYLSGLSAAQQSEIVNWALSPAVVAAPTPTCSLTATPLTVAPGGSSILTATCNPAATSYLWTSTGFAASASSGSVSPQHTTTYYLTGLTNIGSSNAAAVTVTVPPQIDVRSYFPAAASGYTSVLRIVNTHAAETPLFAARIDGATGQVGPAGQLTPSLAAGGATTFTANQIETAIGGSLSATDRPRIRITASGSNLQVQSLLQTGGVWNDVSNAQSGSTVAVATYIPAAAASSGYVSSLRVINTGTTASPVTIAKIDAATGIPSTAGILTASLPAGAAVTYTAQQVESALGMTLTAGDRPRLQISAASSTVDVQSFLQQPGNVLTETSTGQTGSTVDVRSYVPAAAGSGYTSYVRIINESSTATPVTASVIDPMSGKVLASGTVVASLPGNGSVTLSSAQIENTLGIALSASTRPRIRVTSPGGTADLRTQSFIRQPNGEFNEISNATTGPAARVCNYIPAAEAKNGITSYLRVINTGADGNIAIVSLIDQTSGALMNSVKLMEGIPSGAAQTFASAQIEAAMGTTVTAGLRPRIQISGGAGLEVQSFLLQPDGTFTEVSCNP